MVVSSPASTSFDRRPLPRCRSGADNQYRGVLEKLAWVCVVPMAPEFP